MSLEGWNTVYDLGRLLVLILLLIKKQAHYILFVESYTRTIVNIITGQASSLSDSGSSFVTSSVTILSSEAAFSSREPPQSRSHWWQPLAIICHCEVITVQESEWYRALSVSMPATVAGWVTGISFPQPPQTTTTHRGRTVSHFYSLKIFLWNQKPQI